MADYTQPDFIDKRLRYFDGQFLKDQDFIDEQKYHIDRQRRSGRFLNVSGIMDGLTVKAPSADQVTIEPGTALDNNGKHIVLSQQASVALKDNRGATVDLVIAYHEEGADQAQAGSAGFTRFYESPQLTVVKAGDKAPDDAVTLARLSVDASGAVTVNNTVRSYTGLRLPSEGTTPGTGLTLRAGDAGRVDLAGSLSISGNLSVSGTLTATGATTLSGNTGVGGRLSVSGDSMFTGNVSVGTSSSLSFGSQTRQMINLWSANYGIGVQNGTQYFRTDKNFAWYKGGGHSDTELNEGTNGTAQMVINDGKVGIGMTIPRSALDTGIGVMTGAANDYQKAQYTLSGGGTVTWGGPGGRLKWTGRFLAITMGGAAQVYSQGHIEINQPTSDLPAANVYDGRARSATADGIVLSAWEALYAVHAVGGEKLAVTLRIHRYDVGFYAPSNWLLVAVVNGDDGTIKLGTGVILSQRSSSTKGSPVPRGTIFMWSGAINTIPDGWALCDGQNSTPDLRGRFILGRTNDGEAATGGAASHNHGTGYPQGDVPATTALGGASYELGGKFHTHAVTAVDHLPPFFKLAFIIKL